MSRQRDDSFHFYEYLCQKIGSEEDVKARRITSIVCDIGSGRFRPIRSGSNGEGLNLKGSDVDLMMISSEFAVYEYFSDMPAQNQKIPLVMDTDDTQPCFTKLKILCDGTPLCIPDILSHADHTGIVLSSKMFKEIQLDRLSTKFKYFDTIHGPCVADNDDQLDLAICLKCEKWISHSEPWIKRSRAKWPSADVIFKIISCGVLFVPIGGKESINEHIEWRMSYSVSEKFLIFSFNHTQLLFYALLKIFLKEVVDKEICLKGLLCSYFIKTLLFWILEESDPSIWRPDNIIPCFQACLHRLLYCVDYNILLHYFVPENNLFYLRFNAINRNKLCNLLKMSYQQGIQYLFATETLMDYPKYSGEINQPLCRNARLVNEIKQTISCGIYAVEEKIYMLLSTLLHYSRSGMSADIFTFFLLRAHQIVPQRLQIPQGSNKLKYIKYQNIISHLLIGVHTDTVTGWIMLACFFYERKQYIKTVSIINYVVLQFTDEKIPIDKSSLNRKQICALNMIANEKLMTSLQTLTTHTLVFVQRSLIIPTELQLDVQKHNFLIHPKLFALFLGFLCCYHLKDSASCNYFIRQLLQVLKNIINGKRGIDAADVRHIFICIGIAMQMIGETNSARYCLQRASAIDVYNLTSANKLLAELNFND
ncbi:uncharacterized protein LOC127723809 [Mytilus californianus]|uniref:uncharacterized protein LOC127723809 n=1 Tax=Mytilus californianus TaxID=6549 RepID=UPI002246075F|nr:uncharacterized protein LOC127723809 [Mytilus californianus]